MIKKIKVLTLLIGIATMGFGALAQSNGGVKVGLISSQIGRAHV